MMFPTVTYGIPSTEDTQMSVSDVLIFNEGKAISPLLSRLNVAVAEDYGTYALAKADAKALAALESNGIYLEYPTYRIGLESASFETASGEPALPDGLALERYPGETGYYLIQMIGPIKEKWLTALSDSGMRVVGPLSDYAVVVESPPERISSLEQHFIRWTGLYQPGYKLSPYLGNDGLQNVEITLFAGEPVDDVLPAILSLGAEIRQYADYEIGGMIRAAVPAYLFSEIARLSPVAQIAPYVQPQVYNDVATRVLQSGIASTSGARKIFDQGIHGESQLIMYADTGLYTSHEMFYDASNPIGASHRKVRDYYAAGGDLVDGHGHGTHVGGTIGGDAPTYLSYNLRDGHAYAAKLIHADIGVGLGLSPSWPYDDVWDPGYALGARISSNSWGSTYDYNPQAPYYPSEARVLDNYVSNNPDFLLVWAAGNDGAYGSYSIGFQNQAKNILSVGGTQNGLSADAMYSSSSRGPTRDGRLSPQILAPAVNIYSATRTAAGYTAMQGTSMATPAVAGTAALIRQYLAEGWYPAGIKNSGAAITNPSAALMKSLIVISGKEITGTGAYANGETFYPNNQQGWGRVYTDDVLYFDGDAKKLKFWDSPSALGTGGSWSDTFTVTDSTVPLRVMLTWSDKPALVAGDTTPLVNDLDLTVTDPLGNVYRGNVFTGYDPGRSTTGGSYDRINNLEGVILFPGYGSGAPAGTYTISVNAVTVPLGTQNFALTVLGGVRVTPEASATATGPTGGPTNVGSITLSYTWEQYPESINLYYTTNGGSTWNFAGNDDTVDGTFQFGLTTSATYGWYASAVGDSPEPSPPPPGTPPEAASYIFNNIAPDPPTGLTVEHWGPTSTGGNTVTQNRYMRNNQVPVNGRNFYVLGTTDTTSSKYVSGTNAGTHYWGIRVYKNSAAGVNTSISGSSTVAVVSRSADGEGLQQATWTPPQIALEETDTIYIDIYNGPTNPPTTRTTAPFQTERLDASQLGNNQWTINYWTYKSGSTNRFYWGDSTQRYSFIQGFQYTVSVKNWERTDHNTINWTHDGTGVSQYNIYRSDAQSGTYSFIDSVPVGTNTYTDIARGLYDITRWWYIVRAEDAIGNEDANTDSAPEPSAPPYAIDLADKSPGSWVFVSYPSGLTGSIQAVLNDATSGDGQTTWSVAKAYDNQNKRWLTYRAGYPSTLTAIDNTMGVWLKLDANGGDKKLTLSEYAVPPASTDIYLYAGWNMVGYPSATARTASATLPAQADVVSVWQAAAPYVSDSDPSTVTMSQGNAYWVHVTADSLWTVLP
ncbi:MAG: S8 family serine peptidase [Thermoplasmata archaeon]